MAQVLRVLPLSLFLLAACQDDESTADQPLVTPPPMEAFSEASAGRPSSTAGREITGTVVETMNSGGYTYVRLNAGSDGQVWAAGLSTEVAPGDTVSILGGTLMQEFESKTLNRTFKDIYFANTLRVVERASSAPRIPKAQHTPEADPKIEVEKVEGGYTVAELFGSADALAGREVTVRGQVVKFNGGILGKNWLHVRDGTGTTGSNDLTVTTDATANVGDLVVIRGQLATNKDFGAGYSYPVIVEGASIAK
ncbi:MAG: hypothetical protein AAGD10_04180 [Myxococcota bacterium]